MVVETPIIKGSERRRPEVLTQDERRSCDSLFVQETPETLQVVAIALACLLH